MGRKNASVTRGLIGRGDLARLGADKLAELLAEQISALPYHEQKQWAARHLPREQSSQPATEVRPADVLREIEAFCRLSRQGTYQSWVDEHEWDGGFEGGDDSDEFEEWVELFTEVSYRTSNTGSEQARSHCNSGGWQSRGGTFLGDESQASASTTP